MPDPDELPDVEPTGYDDIPEGPDPAEVPADEGTPQ